MRIRFTRTFQTSCRGTGFTEGEVHDMSPSAATHWIGCGVAEPVAMPTPIAVVDPADEPPDIGAAPPAPAPARSGRRKP